jgi:D-glycero-alpha-D-manno-heptose 1-phosphate guanylyltransferase
MLEAIVLAGGFGTRLKEVVPDLPKPMAPIHGKPFLAYLLSNLAEKGFKKVILSVGFMAEKIIDYFGESYLGIELVYVVEDKPLGTGGALRLALNKCSQDYIFVFNGDTFLDFDIESIEDCWLHNQCSIIIGVEVKDTARYGRLIFENNKVRGFLEKGSSGPGIINAGCYVLKVNQLNSFKIGEVFSLEKDYLVNAVKSQDFLLYTVKGTFIDIGVPEDYFLAQTLLIDFHV